MIVNPADIVARKILQWIANPQKQIQQNGVDIRINRIFKISGECYLGEEKRNLPKREEIFPDAEWVFVLSANETYDIEFFETVDIPLNMNGTLIQRSSLNRMWAFFSCWVYDSWYKWLIWAILRPSLEIKIEKGVRAAQFVFQFADWNGLYDGKYQYWSVYNN